jgi:hypothetical protein
MGSRLIRNKLQVNVAWDFNKSYFYTVAQNTMLIMMAIRTSFLVNYVSSSSLAVQFKGDILYILDFDEGILLYCNVVVVSQNPNLNHVTELVCSQPQSPSQFSWVPQPS